MKESYNFLKIQNFKSRKRIHYSLIASIILIQFLIVGFFFNEYVVKKNLNFLENQLKEIHTLENLTENSRKELFSAQSFLQEYFKSEEKQYLKSYFESLNRLGDNLENIGRYENKLPKFKKIILSQKKDSFGIKKLKSLIDSTHQFTEKSNFKFNNSFPSLKKYILNYNFDKFEVETKTHSDSIKKKGLFGRIGDAISGKENIRKENTVITIKHSKEPNPANIKSEFDSIMNVVNNHYSGEVKKIKINVTNNQNNTGKFYDMFSNLLTYSNGLMNIYGIAIKDVKTDLEKEYEMKNSSNNRVRIYLLFSSMILMLTVSILIMLLTRIAFNYENQLNIANKQINENLRFKNRILGMLSHELRSPLKIISLFINKINLKTKDQNIKEYLKSISFTNNSLLIQANQILEYSKNQQVENRLNSIEFNLKQEIDSILKSIKPYIETRNNKFIIEENIDPNIVVNSDNTKINQIFMNILGNANKFTENGEIKVDTNAIQIDQNIISLQTIISDTGIGISKSDLEKIFEPYYQGILSDDVENLGAGLGLSLCRDIVNLFSGKISVNSEPNKGTKVTFSINFEIKK